MPKFEQKISLPENLPGLLLAWFDGAKREMPWRGTRDPYKIWLSEIMLQQTRVETVREYYLRFLAAFPTVRDLAAAPEEKLMKLWQGLGYYSRARHLAAAAAIVVEKYGGKFPAEPEILCTLPGIGLYTAGAIASIAFEKPVPAVDGNVARVISRLTGTRAEASDVSFRAAVSGGLAEIYPQTRCGDFTQSLMELGATVCLPNGVPFCESCPLKAFCYAAAHDCASELPVRKVKKERPVSEMTVCLLENGGRIALRKRPETGLLAGLWEFPHLPGRLGKAALAASLAEWPLDLEAMTRGRTREHIFTHRKWILYPWRIVCTGKGAPSWRWVRFSELEKAYPLPAAFGKLLAEE